MNEEKTRICKVPEGEFDFLGYTFGRMFSARTGQARIGYRPSKNLLHRRIAFPIRDSGREHQVLALAPSRKDWHSVRKRA